ncbi:rod-binding protein [Parendozoicomonas haliclonae]|uniref:Peptidoglycan hydrolase FlgJ n=1 Tax=Parendozoicomonas haliclonae TaxID=1960125 RepID=A0A1X7AH59_9GAMM|nr:rod-binding protein [Parendozoicomonas haliclonae]SMA39754.1 Peptidoglycan hydrolase FlgJ [Parendozoicomonas haliclonae]
MNIDSSALLTSVDLMGKQGTPKDLKEAAEAFESLFINMMLKSARQANAVFAEDSLFGSSQMDMYQSLFDSQIAQEMSQSGKFGLADMLVKQLGGEPDSGTAIDVES